MQKIDFTPLKQRRNPLQLLRGLHDYSTAWKVGSGVLMLCFAIALILLVLGIVLSLTNDNDNSGFFWMAGFFAICGLLGFWDIAHELSKNDRMRRFAKANGLTFECDTFGDDSYHGTYFANRFVRIADMLRTPGDRFLELGNFRIIGQQERSSSGPTYGYIRMKLPRRLPHMMLASKFARQDLPIAATLDPDQKLSLEGDFNRTFTLYAPKQYERDALYVFTPDVMTKFMDLFGKFNAEIVDDEIYFFSSRKFDLTNPAVFTQLLEAITDFAKKFDHQIDYYSDERSTEGETATAANTVALPGRRLRSSLLLRIFYWLLAAAALVLLAAGAYFLIKESIVHKEDGVLLRNFASLAITIIVVFLVGVAARWWARRQH